MDEFRGKLDIAHFLRWTDRYALSVEIKNSSRPLKATKFWFTSNLHPKDWYPEADEETQRAILRRFKTILKFDNL